MTTTDEFFEKLFAIFPTKRKGTRRMAYPAWVKAIKREEPEVILAGAIAYAASEPGEYAKGLPAWAYAWNAFVEGRQLSGLRLHKDALEGLQIA